ncbi:MAG TPA: hypothetical protein VFI49_09565 [Rudaea sp.]|nr:hypothetical protein [Rudaea sp.]
MLDEGRRLQVLAAMGVDVYQLRGVSGVASAAAPAPTAAGGESAGAAAANVVAVCARGARVELRLARLFAQLPRALGTAAARLTWIEMAADGTLPALPDVPCYLFVGSATARACAAQLSLTQQNQATIAVCAEPQELLAGAPARRALWQAIKPLARRLRAEAR